MNQEVFMEQSIRHLNVGKGDAARAIAYITMPGAPERPGLFWLGGFKSSMMGQKATALAGWAKKNHRACTLMDYSGHGHSGGAFEDGTITRWLEEAQAVFEKTTSGPQVIIGSSMGGWLALLLARILKGHARVAGIVLIAPAWDMTERLMWQRFSQDIKKKIEKQGLYAKPSAYGDGDYVITKKLIEDGAHHLLSDAALHLGCPVHILHGRHDPDVPWTHGQALMTLLPRDDVRFTLVPDGDHRLSRAQDLELLLKTIEELSLICQ